MSARRSDIESVNILDHEIALAYASAFTSIKSTRDGRAVIEQSVEELRSMERDFGATDEHTESLTPRLWARIRGAEAAIAHLSGKRIAARVILVPLPGDVR
jgi:hypothetical protein